MNNSPKARFIRSHSARWTLCLLYTVALAVLSLLPSSTFQPIPLILQYMDKVVHFLMYSIYALLLYWAVGVRHRRRWLYLAGIVLFCTAYGCTMEVLQQILRPDDRMFSLGDIAANTAGALTFACLTARRSEKQQGNQHHR